MESSLVHGDNSRDNGRRAPARTRAPIAFAKPQICRRLGKILAAGLHFSPIFIAIERLLMRNYLRDGQYFVHFAVCVKALMTGGTALDDAENLQFTRKRYLHKL